MVAFTFLSLRSALLENLVQNWHILKWFPYYHLYSVGVAKVQTFKNLAPDTKFESLEAQFFARPLRWDGIPNFGWNRVNYLQQHPFVFQRSCCCQVPANRESINPDENCFFKNALVHQLQKRVINTNFAFAFSLTEGISVLVSLDRKQDHQWWRYHRRLSNHQCPYFQSIIE